MRVLVTGMSGVGKSTLVRELRRRRFRAYDADDDGFSEPRGDGRWGWRVERVADVLKEGEAAPDFVFFAGCSEEQVALPFDYRVLLTAPAEILVQRLMARTTKGYGRSAEQRAQVLADLAEVEPLLRRSADLILSDRANAAHRGRSAQPCARDTCPKVLITDERAPPLWTRRSRQRTPDWHGRRKRTPGVQRPPT